MIYQIDYSKLPDLSSCRLRYAMDEKIFTNLNKMPFVQERALNSIRFCWLMQNIEYYLSIRGKELMSFRQGLLRAALAEFVSIEEILKKEIKHSIIQKKVLSIRDSQNPLLHIIRELRNFELHLNSSRMNSNNIIMFWGRKTEPEVINETELQVWTIDNLTVEGISELRNYSRYQKADIEKIINWFNDAQQKWGVHYLIFLAVELFCEEIINFYSIN